MLLSAFWLRKAIYLDLDRIKASAKEDMLCDDAVWRVDAAAALWPGNEGFGRKARPAKTHGSQR